MRMICRNTKNSINTDIDKLEISSEFRVNSKIIQLIFDRFPNLKFIRLRNI